MRPPRRDLVGMHAHRCAKPASIRSRSSATRAWHAAPWSRLDRLVMPSRRSRHHADLAHSIHSTNLCGLPGPPLDPAPPPTIALPRPIDIIAPHPTGGDP
jgi:hypothetical protein